MLGVTIIIPVIPAIFFEGSSSFFASEVSHEMKSFYYGLLLLCYPLLQFFGAPILGSLSDRYGRKPVLSLALIGTLIGYLLFAYAVTSHNLWLLFFSRMLPGFTGGNVSIIMSSISDISDEASRTRNFGLVGMAFGIGFILGPSIGGLLADDTIVHWFTHATPFWVVAILTFVNIILVQFFFKETLKEKRMTHISMFTGIKNIAVSFTEARLRKVFLIVLCVSIGFTFFTQYFSVYLYEKFSWSEKNIGLLYGWVGIWLAITQGVIVRSLSYKFASKDILKFSIPIIVLGISLLMVPTTSWWFYLINPIIAIGIGMTSPNLTTVVSMQAGADRQGEILGINQSMNSLGQIIPAIVGGYLVGINLNFPLLAGAIMVCVAWLIYRINYNKLS